jgi:hypothetical protein
MHSVFGKVPYPWQKMVPDKLSQRVAKNNHCVSLSFLLVGPTGWLVREHQISFCLGHRCHPPGWFSSYADCYASSVSWHPSSQEQGGGKIFLGKVRGGCHSISPLDKIKHQIVVMQEEEVHENLLTALSSSSFFSSVG